MDEYSLVQTHISTLVFTPDHVYKVKKPVVFGFLDMSSAAARAEACRAEVALNSRLAPDVYEGVATFRYPDGRREAVVVMKRLPSERSLSALIDHDDAEAEGYVRRVSATVAAFHADAERNETIDRACRASALTQLWEQNLGELRTVSASILEPAEIDEAGSLSARYIQGRDLLFDERIAAGRAIDGHGDLLCDDIFLVDGGPRILDCLDFSAALRYSDTLSDVASLAMDLESLGRIDLAACFLEEYKDQSGDGWPASLAHLYVAYRASVRAKVACLRARFAGGDEVVKRVSESRRLSALCLRHLRAGEVKLVLVGGLPGTGKSTLAAHIRQATGWTVLSSDVLRKRMAGLAPDADAGAAFGTGLYAPEATATVYSELLEEADGLLRRGQSVIIDASWLRQSWRNAAAELARKRTAALTAIHCETTADLSHRRIHERVAAGSGPSDATVAIADFMAAAVEPWLGAVALDTSLGIADVVVAALDALGLHPGR